MRIEEHYNFPLLLRSEDNLRYHVMAKPAGSSCNLACTYCYYLSKATLPNGPGGGRICDELLRRFIQQHIEGSTDQEVIFSWQGGEPTLMGLDFFQQILTLEKRYAKPGQVIQNDLQTNGTLITEEWCEFLKKNNFLVGLSIDGPRKIHDKYRFTEGLSPTFDKVVRTAELLKQYAIPFNTLTCVNRYNARKPIDIYRFLRREIGSTHIQYIPIVEYNGFERRAPNKWDSASLPVDGAAEARPGDPNSIVTDWSVDPDDWGYFLCRTFDEWLKKDVGKVLVNHFESLAAQHAGLPPQICVYGEICGRALAFENEGSIYSCDHYVYPEYCLGNIKHRHISDMVLSAKQTAFGLAKSKTLPRQCRNCEYLNDCWGECPKNRFLRTQTGEPGLNYLCRGFKKYFRHAIPEVERIVADLRKNGPLQEKKRM